MSRYLEEAARILADAEKHATEQLMGSDKNQVLREIASQYATLAAIDKGLLPVEMVADILRAMPSTGGTR